MSNKTLLWTALRTVPIFLFGLQTNFVYLDSSSVGGDEKVWGKRPLTPSTTASPIAQKPRVIIIQTNAEFDTIALFI
ncbi:MAG: hypothetical protein DWQ04_07850 [Chloroflexi bacterium]|nr:MAG: hypothetical protein DWQ04_07850 [Chloroflexota bacterium]